MTPEELEQLQRVELALGAAVNGLQAALKGDLETARGSLELAEPILVEARARRSARQAIRPD